MPKKKAPFSTRRGDINPRERMVAAYKDMGYSEEEAARATSQAFGKAGKPASAEKPRAKPKPRPKPVGEPFGGRPPGAGKFIGAVEKVVKGGTAASALKIAEEKRKQERLARKAKRLSEENKRRRARNRGG